MTNRAKCSVSNSPKGISALSGFTRPGESFMEASSRRSSVSRAGSIAATTMNVDCGVISALLENLVPVRLVVRHVVHRMPQLRELTVHPPSGAALVAQWAMFGDAMPRIVRESLRELHLRWRVEGLSRKAQRRHRYARRKPLGAAHCIVLDGHEVRIGLQLQANVEVDIFLGERRDHRFAQIVVGRAKRKPWYRSSLLRFRPHRILHRLAFTEKVRNATEIRRLERAALRLDPQRLHDEVEHVRTMEIEEIENRRVLHAFDLQLRVRLGIRGHEGRSGNTEHV